MTSIDIYGKDTCKLCPHVKRKVVKLIERWGLSDSVPIRHWDMGEPTGLAEAAFNDVHKTPTTVVMRGEEVARWSGKAPDSAELKQAIYGP
ncbi:unnamed protein product [marine sediment metagenome]|uniref:Thioredoxin-like fold domain-containing protein n=1 Tax=marine sediment metagenome TaxID=412755 RepID=X0UR36_9ZZZZ